MPTMAVGKGFFDQYSVFCVFGSVVGCVVVPLITQSVECVIFSAIVISLAATQLTKKSSGADSSTKGSPTKDSEKRKHKEGHGNSANKKRTKELPQNAYQDKEHIFRKQQEHSRKEEQQKLIDMEKKLEEKKTKKAKKREERLRKKESETKEKCELDEKIKSIQEKRLKQHKDEVKKTCKGSSIAALDRFCQDEPEYMQLRRRSICDENKKTGQRIPRLERPRLHSHPPSSQKKGSTKTSPTNGFLPIKISPLSLSSSSLSSIGSNQDQEYPSAPPSVWKLPPQDIQPQWKPGKSDYFPDMYNKSLLCKSVSDGDKCSRHQGNHIDFHHNPIDRTLAKLAAKHGDILLKESTNQSLFSAHQDPLHCTINDVQFGEYSLFGPNELDKVLLKQPVM